MQLKYKDLSYIVDGVIPSVWCSGMDHFTAGLLMDVTFLRHPILCRPVTSIPIETIGSWYISGELLTPHGDNRFFWMCRSWVLWRVRQNDGHWGSKDEAVVEATLARETYLRAITTHR